jgi:hypothetical protein
MKYNLDDNVGEAQFNMGVASMQRIDSLLRKLHEYNSMLYLAGSPMHSMIIRLLVRLYTEIYPYLDKKEIKYANDRFLDVFLQHPIINTGTSLLVPFITETRGNEFELWLYKTMFEKGILTKIGESPYDIEM